MAVALVVAVVTAVISLVAISRVQWPAYNSSNQLHALTTVGQFGCLAVVLVSGLLWRRGWHAIARGAALVSLSAFAFVTLAMPLGATKLYLFGISVDQQFRTEYLTRLTDTAGPHDMTYSGLPPFYPPGWFWIGGRLATLTGTPGWEIFKPWAIISITIAVVLAFVLWASMIRFEYALIVIDRHRRGDARVLDHRALRRDHRRAPATGVRARLVGPAGRDARWRPGRGHRRRRIPRRRRALLHPAVGICHFTLTIMAVVLVVAPPAPRTAAAARRHRGDRRRDRAHRLGPVPTGRSQRASCRFRHRSALSACRGSPARVPDVALHSARRAVHGRHAVAGGARPQLDQGRCAGRRGIGALRVVAAVDADHPGRHHAAVVPAAANADDPADRRGRVRVHRSHARDRPPTRATDGHGAS